MPLIKSAYGRVNFTGFLSVTYKLATDVYKKCLHVLVPPFLADDDCVPVTTVAGRPHLRSADSRCVVVPRTKTVLVTHNFAVACPLVRSGGASAVKEPGHFEVRKSSSQVTRSLGVHFFY